MFCLWKPQKWLPGGHLNKFQPHTRRWIHETFATPSQEESAQAGVAKGLLCRWSFQEVQPNPCSFPTNRKKTIVAHQHVSLRNTSWQICNYVPQKAHESPTHEVLGIAISPPLQILSSELDIEKPLLWAHNLRRLVTSFWP